MVLKLQAIERQTIQGHAEATYPDECCGIMLGYLSDDAKTLVQVWATQNAWSTEASESFPATNLVNSKTHRYTIDPAVLLQAQREARDRHLDIIGIYHSHPDHPAIPSEYDRVCAWHQYSYIIVSVQQGKACDLQCWSLDDNHQFQPEKIIVD